MNSQLILSSGKILEVKGAPEDVEKALAAGPHSYVAYDHNHNDGTTAGTFRSPAFVVFESVDSRHRIRVDSSAVIAILELESTP